MRLLQPIQGDLDFYHENGVISKVTVEIAGVGSRRVRMTTLPPEVTEADNKCHVHIWRNQKDTRRNMVARLQIQGKNRR